MNARQLWTPKVGEWVFGSAMAVASVVPAAVPGDLEGGCVACQGAREVLCTNPSNPNDPCTNGLGMHSTCAAIAWSSGPAGCYRSNIGLACPTGCVPTTRSGCTYNNTCYY